MCGILAVLGCSDDSQAKRVRVLELSRRQYFLNFALLFLFITFVIEHFDFVLFGKKWKLY